MIQLISQLVPVWFQSIFDIYMQVSNQWWRSHPSVNYVKSVSITTSHFCFTSHIKVHISACSWPILLKFWCKHIYSELSNQWWKPHLSLSTCLEIGACQRHYYQARNDHHEVKSPPPHFWVMNEKSATRFFFCWFSAIQGTHREWNMEKLEEGTFAVLESPRYEACNVPKITWNLLITM